MSKCQAPRDTVSAVSSQSSVFSPGRIMAFPVTSRTVNFLNNGTQEPLLCPHWSFPGVGVHPYLLPTPHLGMTPSLHLFTPLKRRWSTTSIFSWASPSQQGPLHHTNNSGQGEESKSVFCPHGSCGLQWGRWSHCWSQIVDPTVTHSAFLTHCIARVSHWDSGWPSRVVLKLSSTTRGCSYYTLTKIHW